MRVPDDHPLNVTRAFRTAGAALAAVEAAREHGGAEVLDGLFELAVAETNAAVVVATLRALAERDTPLSRVAVRRAAGSRFALARQFAIHAMDRLDDRELDSAVVKLLTTDPSWVNRRAALTALAAVGRERRWEILRTADDPHWRVRHALGRVLTAWGASETDQQEINCRLAIEQFEEGINRTRRDALLAYLTYRWTGREPGDGTAFGAPDPFAVCPFWDWDAAVLAVRLKRMTAAERAAHVNAMPFLAGHEDGRVWKSAVSAIREHGESHHYRAVLALRADPRNGAEPAIERLLDGLDEERKHELTTGPFGRRSVGEREPLEAIAGSPFQRAAALTPTTAAGIVAEPTSETSWHVIEAAGRLAKVPIWEVEPLNPWTPPTVAKPSLPPLVAPLGAGVATTLVGPDRIAVSRVGVSGHYLLPVEGFVEAAAAGVNWFFWEPNYATLTAFSSRLSASDRRPFHFVAGTFEADGRRIRADVERALRELRVERLGIFFLFWVQSWDRLTDDVRDTSAALRAEGKIAAVGLSSHRRPLLVRAMADGWDVVMARHSAAHRGAETELFPAVPPGTTLITFNNLCYGRLLEPTHGLTPPTAADCYRYTLSFPQVAACWSAPATVEQLRDNLAALREPELDPGRRDDLRAFGAKLYQHEKVFERLVRML
ncbi:HEAT repeat domain-containing protein [Limnoglobus roseus]|uniref:Aldo/keto reductase n=1 Tax=Limnoglobus roseus TaxID=2598579 RepID=A0A5C1AEC2_9BACT|nr:HEAT repeat domain-containing protein [Limnoglobus roseus]QEL16376.1 aldo/keto reductase [Limnoglobus roseus]